MYLDDIMVFSRTAEEHERHLREVFERLQSHQLCVKRKKCAFGLKQVEYLGHIVAADGVRPDPAKVSAVADWPTPTGVRDVQSFLGLANYFNRFIRGFARLALPLTSLLLKNTVFVWGEA